jgi:hypothetical protein
LSILCNRYYFTFCFRGLSYRYHEFIIFAKDDDLGGAIASGGVSVQSEGQTNLTGRATVCELLFRQRKIISYYQYKNHGKP